MTEIVRHSIFEEYILRIQNVLVCWVYVSPKNNVVLLNRIWERDLLERETWKKYAYLLFFLRSD